MRKNSHQDLISSFYTADCSNTKLSNVPVRGFLTVLSGSKGSGGHASMFVECYINAKRVLDGLDTTTQVFVKKQFDKRNIKYGSADDDRVAATMLVDLTTDLGLGSSAAGSRKSGSGSPGGLDVLVGYQTVQIHDMLGNGNISNVGDVGLDLADATGKHTISYDLTRQSEAAFWRAVERFMGKVAKGRYTYRLAGGALGWLSTRPGKRGINCADFVIKILNETGLSSVRYHLVDTPHRVAHRG